MALALFVFALVLAASVESVPFEAHIAFTDVQYEVSVSLRNTQSTPITVSLLGTPLRQSSGDVRADAFDIVTAAGVPARYIGILVKYRADAGVFQTLQPNETITAKVNLLKGYSFPETATYTIHLNSRVSIEIGNSTDLTPSTIYPLTSTDSLSLQVNQSAPILTSHRLQAVTAISNCTSDQIKILEAQALLASTLASQASGYMNKVSCAKNPTYTTWFGTCDDTRYTKIQADYTAILNRMNAGYRFNCSKGTSNCVDDGAVSYVNFADPSFTVHVCDSYFSLPRTLCTIDSAPGTLVHELSHFTAVSNTLDVVGGVDRCKELARSLPTYAWKNADSHEYFAETCPSVATFVNWDTVNLNKGQLPADTIAGEAVAHAVTIDCLKAGKACTVFKQNGVTLSNSFAAFSPALNVAFRQVVPISSVTLQLWNANGDGPSAKPAVPLFLYLTQAPPYTTFTFTPKPTVATGIRKVLEGSVLTVDKTAWSGVLKFPIGTTKISWVGVRSNATTPIPVTPTTTTATLRMTFTLAWVYVP